ncbi:hypothetical protein RRG08_057599, partial [Elysia crispata]
VTRSTIAGVPVIVYKDWDDEDAYIAQFVYFHGGGVDSCICSYRLAPQHPFPMGFDDVVSVTRYILRHGGRSSADASRVGVAVIYARGYFYHVQNSLTIPQGMSETWLPLQHSISQMSSDPTTVEISVSATPSPSRPLIPSPRSPRQC